MTGRSTPVSNSGSISAAKRWVRAIFSSSGRGRSTVPMTAARLPMSLPRSARLRPLIMPTWMMRPLRARASMLRSTSSPPTTSSTTSTPRGTCERSSPSQSWGDRSSTRSAPSSRHTAAFPDEQVDGDAGADRLGDLDAGGAHARRAGVDERPAPRREAALHHEGVPCGEEHLGDGGPVGDADRRRHGHHLALVDGDPLGVAAAADDAHHCVARLPQHRPAAPGARRGPRTRGRGSRAPSAGPGSAPCAGGGRPG